MIHGIGTDVLDIDKIKALKADYTDSFFCKAFTDCERDQAFSRTDPDIFFATRFAAKEAVFKCLGIDGNHVRLCDIEIITDSLGIPRVRLCGMLHAVAEQQGIKNIHLSLSWDGPCALAFAIAEK